MTIFRGGTGGFSGGVRAAVLFMCVILVCSQFGFHFSVHNEEASTSTSISGTFHPPGKAQILDTAVFHAPSSTSFPDTVYEDDKRIVHTGPNPLHN
ncbi:CLAVATA3/ESR-RELATED 16 [Hibiscus trionum]|uniref:CLAVATA3/ESR-RELATED 16 n=1 Tax=Hibiscus trionum TaxID=183268 RepID=A0A9W7HDI7_HIBTR|nr:CLAVATA3/ESR-RELATED 16 [Hibiscus trionum]